MKAGVLDVFHALDDICIICGIDLASHENQKAMLGINPYERQ